MMMWGYDGFGFGHGGIGMGIGMLLFWVVLIVAVVVLVRGFRARSSEGAPRMRESAMDILRERYARGEIDKSDFEARRRDLESAGTHG